jgi:hypothetical protein
MALPNTVALIADRLNATGASWMATGSIAAMTYGDYRVTSDIDIILDLAIQCCENGRGLPAG